ncbi:MAG: hypothetical protein P8163_05630 [Candidatus Thiodiazotropha sp.]
MNRNLVVMALASSLFCSTTNAASSISRDDVIAAEKRWGDAIIAIGKAYADGKDYKNLANDYVDKLYAYDEGSVLFKPTKAAEKPFRTTEEEAVSYFVTGEVAEDHGFALQPWSKVRFENSGIITDEDSATAMGHYYFTDAKTNQEVEAEYTLEFMKDQQGQMLITVHHSSFPYQPKH